MTGRLDLHHLQVFARVVQHGGMTQAGKQLGLTQPTVSGHMASLEQEVGTKLLHRGGGRAKPTAAGELLYKYAKQIVDLAEAAVEELDTFLGLRQGELRVGASTTPATYFLPPYLTTFAAAHPKVRLALTVGDTREVLEALDEGRVEFAVVGDEVESDRYQAHAVATDRIVLVVGRSHPWFTRAKVKVEELKGKPLIVRGEGSATLAAVEHVLDERKLEIGRDVPIALRLPTNEAIREAVANGNAMAFLPRSCLVGRDKELKTVELEGLVVERPFVVVQSLAREPGPAAKALLQLLEKPA